MNWISVESHLPNEDTSVLVAAGKYVTVADWYVKSGWTVSREDSAVGTTSETITHWMPLPKPPLTDA